MNILVTGGTGFIGRWVVGRLLKDGHKVWEIDIQKLLCNFHKAENTLFWKPKVAIEEGIKQTEKWMQSTFHRKDCFKS